MYRYQAAAKTAKRNKSFLQVDPGCGPKDMAEDHIFSTYPSTQYPLRSWTPFIRDQGLSGIPDEDPIIKEMIFGWATYVI